MASLDNRTTEKEGKGIDLSLCSFCQKSPAVISVQRPVPHRLKKRYSQRLCLLHYYSTSAVREREAVTVIDSSLLQEQIPSVQELFAEAFIQLQQAIQEETMQTLYMNTNTTDNSSSINHDPLAVVNDWHRRRSPKLLITKKPSIPKTTTAAATEGGFLRNTPLPPRWLEKQQQQAKKQQELEKRMKLASMTDLTRKRKPTRTNIWNQVSQDNNNNMNTTNNTSTTKTNLSMDNVIVDSNPTCSSCHSNNVIQMGNWTSRNGDMAKGETWGSKDRGDDVLGRYQCQKCGKVWNEAE